MNLAAFKKRFLAQFHPRWHMTLVLGATILAGLCLSRLLWWVGLHNMLWRFPLVLLLSYACFLFFMRLLLLYITDSFGAKRRSSSGSWLDGDVVIGGGGGGSKPDGESLFQGGSSGGGGASGSFDGPDTATPVSGLAVASQSSSPASSSDVGGGLGKATGEALSDLGDDGWVLIVLGLIVVAMAGSAIFIIWEAPVIISEAAFQCLLAGGLMRQAKQATAEDWLGSLWRHTWKPLAFTLVLTVAAAALLQHWCPQASKVSEAIRLCL